MPIPLIVPIVVGAGSFIAGALSRQPEINRLKKQVKVLQEQIEKLQFVIQEQQRQIEEYKLRYKALKGYHWIEKRKCMGVTKGFLVLQYAFKEYIELSIAQASGKNINENELRFYNAYNALMSDIVIPDTEKLFINVFIKGLYRDEIEHLIPLNEGDQKTLINRVETADVN